MHNTFCNLKGIKKHNFVSAGNSKDFLFFNGKEFEFDVILYGHLDKGGEVPICFNNRTNGFGNGVSYGFNNGAIIAWGDGSGDGEGVDYRLPLSFEEANA